jgi:hypothetical protein
MRGSVLNTQNLNAPGALLQTGTTLKLPSVSDGLVPTCPTLCEPSEPEDRRMQAACADKNGGGSLASLVLDSVCL